MDCLRTGFKNKKKEKKKKKFNDMFGVQTLKLMCGVSPGNISLSWLAMPGCMLPQQNPKTKALTTPTTHIQN